MNQISITLNNDELKLLESTLKQYEVASNNIVITHLYKFHDATISIYKTNVMLIQAKEAEKIYEEIFHFPYQDVDKNNNEKFLCDIDDKMFEKDIKINQEHIATVGSDEVGTGDFFGGIVICSAYIKPEQISWLKSIGINDSKKISDEKIKELFNLINNEIVYDVINLMPQEYNQQFQMYENSNVIKAVCHNQALWNLSKKIKRPYFVIIDQFANNKIYSQYLRQAHKTEYTIDIFETKAESKYLAVACASIIARYYFLEQIENLNNALGCKLLLGSSNQEIKTLAKQILETKGIDVLKNITKNHFITFKEVVGDNNEQ